MEIKQIITQIANMLRDATKIKARCSKNLKPVCSSLLRWTRKSGGGAGRLRGGAGVSRGGSGRGLSMCKGPTARGTRWLGLAQ